MDYGKLTFQVTFDIVVRNKAESTMTPFMSHATFRPVIWFRHSKVALAIAVEIADRRQTPIEITNRWQLRRRRDVCSVHEPDCGGACVVIA